MQLLLKVWLFGIVMAAIYPFVNYMNFGMWIMWGMGSFLMIPLVIITLAKANELFRSSIEFNLQD